MELSDDVTTMSTVDMTTVNNTVFGQFLLDNIEEILMHFHMNNETETLVDNTHGSKHIPLGFKR